MDRKDLTELLERGIVLDVLRFGPGNAHRFTYAVMLGATPPGSPRADYASGLLVVTIDPVVAELWVIGTRVGFDEEQTVDGGTIRVILEKDFACLDRPSEDEAEDAWAFPNPSVACK
jgi:hypothetical protein